MEFMKKLSFALLVGLSILAISAFTFCSSAGAKDTLDSSAENLPAVQKEAVQKESEKAATTKPAPASIDPVSKEEDGMTWYLDLNSAVDKSKAEGKPILGFFTGSDWCGWCIKLQNGVRFP